jgi:phosphonate transport system substrate-binding protein
MTLPRLLASCVSSAAALLIAGCGSSTGDGAGNSPRPARGGKPEGVVAASVPGEKPATLGEAPRIPAPAAKGTPDPDAGRPKGSLFFGVYPSDSPLEMYKQFLPLCEYLSKATGYNVDLYVAPNYEEGIEKIRKGEVDFFRSGAGSYGRLCLEQKERRLVPPVLVAVETEEAEGEKKASKFRGAIVVRQDSPIRTLADLRDRNFAFGDARSTMGSLVPRKILQEAGITVGPGSKNLSSHDNVALAVVNGEFEAGACKAPTAEKYRDRGLRVLQYTSYFPSKPVYARADLSPATVEAVRKALLALDSEDPAHRQILKAVDSKLTGYRPGNVADYEEFARFLGSDSDEPPPSPPAPSK